MAEEKRAASMHKVIIDRRERMSISGVLDVISFDEETIVAETEQGVIIVKGINLHVNNLNLDNGQFDIDGEIDSLNYENPNSFGKNKGSFLGKIFK